MPATMGRGVAEASVEGMATATARVGAVATYGMLATTAAETRGVVVAREHRQVTAEAWMATEMAGGTHTVTSSKARGA